jgi:hypothetical protein
MSDHRLTDGNGNSMEQISCCEAKSSANTRETPRNFENRKFITVYTVSRHMYTVSRHMSPTWPRLIQSTLLRPVSLRSSVMYVDVFQVISLCQISPPKFYTHLFCPSRLLHVAVITLHLLTLIIFANGHVSLSSILCIFSFLLFLPYS